MSAEQNAISTPGAGLSKTPSPLSTATSPAVVVESGETLEADDAGLQMRTRQPTNSANNRALTSTVPPADNGEMASNQLSPLADMTPTKPTALAIPEKTTPVKKSKKELAKEAKEAKQRRKAEEKQKAIEASRVKADAAREKKKREDAEKAKKEAEKKAAKLKSKQEKELAKSKKKLVSQTKPAPSTLTMPATPLKGRTKDLSAATPTSFPATPATPAEPVRLLDMASSSGQSLNPSVKPLPLSTQAILGSKEQQDRLQTASNGMQTPQRGVPSSTTPQSPAISSVKSKRSLFGTLRKKFGSSPAPISSSKAHSMHRDGRATPLPTNSGSDSVLSIPPTKTIDHPPSSSTASPSADLIAKNPEGVSGDPTGVVGPATSTNDAPTVPVLSAGVTAQMDGSAAEMGNSVLPAVNAASDPLAESVSSSGQSDSLLSRGNPASNGSAALTDDAATMISKAKAGGLHVDLHVKYIQDLDTVRTVSFSLLTLRSHTPPFSGRKLMSSPTT